MSSRCDIDDKTHSLKCEQSLWVKLLTLSGPFLKIRKPVLNNQLDHYSLPLFLHGIM